MIELTWQLRSHRVEARALVLWGSLRQQAIQRLQQYTDADLQQLALVPTGQCWVLIGPLKYLPWLDGVAYAAPDKQAADLWLPLHVQPSVCSTLLLQQLKQQHQYAPFLLWPEPPALICLNQPYTLSRAVLDRVQELLP